jgi:hypothetical protein
MADVAVARQDIAPGPESGGDVVNWHLAAAAERRPPVRERTRDQP